MNDVNNLGSDLWAMEINHNDPRHGATALFNGNIAETEWRTANTDNSLRWYRYGYDDLNRLVSATDNTTDQRYSLANVTYDKNGNIQSLARNGFQNGSFANMDVLDYDYDAGNKLLKVRDDGNDNYGFKDSGTDDQDYWYDADGNLTRDDNKGITDIEYNHFDRPTKVTVTGSNAGTLDFVYAADGTKLRKIKTQGGVTTTDYAGNHIYENGTLVQFTHPEGHVVPEGSGWRYVYDYTDHLGTVRLSYSDLDGNGTIDAASEILQERNTYPFGLVHKGYNGQINGPENNYQTYLGQEINKELGLDWLSFRHRNYIPEIGRFFGVDPIAEEYPNQTPYQFASNNPVWKIELEGLEGFPTTEEDYINGLGYGVSDADGGGVSHTGDYEPGFISKAVDAVGSFFGAIHDGLSGAIESGVSAVMGTAETNNSLTDSEFNDAVSAGDENAVFVGMEAEAAAIYNETPAILGEAGAMMIEGAAAEFIGPKAPATKPKLKGAANPKVRASIEAGKKAHADIQGKAAAKGWGVEVPMTDPQTGKNVRADLVTPGGSPVEIKPNTPSGRAKGKKQLPQYERATGNKGRVITYDPKKYMNNN